MRRFWAIASVAVLLIGAACSGLAATSWASYVRVQATRSFEVRASTTADALSSALQQNTDLAQTARVLVETRPSIGDPQFANWFRLLEAHDAYPSSFGLLYISSVGSNRLHAFEDRARSEPPFGVAVPGSFHVEPERSTAPYCLTDAGAVNLQKNLGIPPASITPLLALAATDLDFCALPIGSLLRASARSGRPSAATLASLLDTVPKVTGSAPLPRSLVQALDHDGLITTLTPVYDVDARTASSPAARMAALQGWILEVFDGRTVLAPVLADHRDLSAVLSFSNPRGGRVVLDVAGSREAAEAATAGALGVAHAGTTDARGGTPAATTKTFQLAGPGPWTVTLAAAPTGTSAATQGVVVLLAGLLVSFLLFAVVRLLVRSRRHAFHLVDQRTAELHHQALHDPLTGLPNRAAMFDRVETALARARDGTSGVAVVLVDLDQFGDVNDRFGSNAGDDVLCQVAGRFRAVVGHTGTLGRLGGDDFLIVLEGDRPALHAKRLAGELLGALREPFRARGTGTDGSGIADGAGATGGSPMVSLSGSFGIASGARNTAETLVSDAGIARLEAVGTDTRVVIFRPEMRAAVQRRIQTESELRSALAEGQFFLVYQPIFDLRELRLAGVEALLRWDHPARGVVAPDEFIPALESTGMIIDVGRQVLIGACHQLARWRAASTDDLYVSVNVSAVQLERDEFVTWVREALESARLAPDALQLEITETALMRDADLSAHRLNALERTGVKLAIDDFGTGYCSLAYLRLFPVYALKIDRTFVTAMESTAAGSSLVRTVLRMAEDLGVVTVAEGIETASQLDALRCGGCNLGQGFLLSTPLTVTRMSELIERRVPLVEVGSLEGAGSLDRTAAL